METASYLSMLAFEGFSWETMWSVLYAVLPIWLFGAIVGLLLPRPKWLSGNSRSTTLLLSTPAGTLLRRLAIALHALVILKEVWTYFTHPGTFRGLLKATLQWLCGKGWSFQWPASVAADSPSSRVLDETTLSARTDSWYVGEKDLAFFKYHALDGGACPGASAWEVMFQKDLPGFIRYTAWRRTLPSGITEYKSVTTCPNATAQEFMDMYLDDDFRRNWDGMVIHHEVLEHGDFSQRQQVVRWVRRFPFSFLSDREYTIARRVFHEPDGAIVACTKALPNHPREVQNSSLVKMEDYWSMWHSRTVADPWGGEAPACETTLLHMEAFKIPERLARFAVRHGMWGFLRKLASTVPQYVVARRKRAGPHEVDAAAYGAGFAPNPPLRSTSKLGSCQSLDSMSSSGLSCSSCGTEAAAGSDCSSGVCSSCGGSLGGASSERPQKMARSKSMTRLAGLLLAGGVAVALTSGRSSSTGNLKALAGSSSSSGSSRRGLRRHQRLQKAYSVSALPSSVSSHAILEDFEQE